MKLFQHMGALHKQRTEPTNLGRYLQADISGPYKIKNFVNQRGPSRKIYLLVFMDQFTRYISAYPLEALDKTSVFNAFQQQFYRFGRPEVIETDLFSTFKSIANDMQRANQPFTTPSQEDINSFTQDVQSQGVTIKQRVGYAHWQTGGAERAIGILQNAIGHLKGSRTVFQFINSLDKALFLVNRRPIGLSTTLDSICPSDYYLNSKTTLPAKTHEELLSHCSLNERDFIQKWQTLYLQDLLSQKKWFSQNHQLRVHDIVMLLDTKNEFDFPKLAEIIAVSNDSKNNERYFTCRYKTATGRTSCSTRVAQSLVLILRAEERLDIPATILDNASA